MFSGNDNLRFRRATLAGAPIASPVLGEAALLPMTTFPNPFTSGMRAEFHLSGPRPVRMDVRDLLVRPVITLLDQALGHGVHSVDWNGRDERGARVAAGVYFLRLDVDGDVQSRRIVRLR